jgi:uncharacterized protein YciI
MPLFALHALDRADSLPLRLEHYADHRAFVETAPEYGLHIMLSGPLQSDDGEIMTGSLLIIEAPDRTSVEHFVKADPFVRAGLWENITISRFHRRKG